MQINIYFISFFIIISYFNFCFIYKIKKKYIYLNKII